MNLDSHNIPEPKLLEVPDVQDVFVQLKQQLLNLDASLENALQPQNPIYRLLETFAYREVYYKSMINEQTKALFIKYAKGSDLDNLALLFNIARKEIQKENLKENKLQILEDDDSFRKRIINALNGLTNAGTPAAYKHHAISIDDSIKDAAAVNQGSGRVLITLLSYKAEGGVDATVVEKAIKHLNSAEIKPLCDLINVISAKVNKYDLKVKVYFKTNVDAEAEILKLQELAIQWRIEKFYLGKHIYLSQLIKKLHLPSIEKLNILMPTQDLISKEEEAFLLDKVEFDYEFIE